MALYDQNLNQKINAQPSGEGSQDPQTSDDTKSESTPLSVYDIAQRLGLIGIFDGPGDLSTNKAYFEDFGK